MQKQHPILFSTEMVRAILDGRKTMTRRLVKPQPEDGLHDHSRFPLALDDELEGWWGVVDETGGSKEYKFPYGDVGEILWVRETFGFGTRPDPFQGWVDGIEYKADEAYIDEIENLPLYPIPDNMEIKESGWRPSIHMPKEAARIWLKITNIEVERLQDISQEDAVREDIEIRKNDHEIVYKHYLKDKWGPSPIHSFQTLWEKINGPESWNANPWVWVISFDVLSITGKPDNI